MDPDARVARKQEGAPDRAPQAEPAVDLDRGVLVGLTVQAADRGDPAALGPPLAAVAAVAEAQGGKPQTVVAPLVRHHRKRSLSWRTVRTSIFPTRRLTTDRTCSVGFYAGEYAGH